MQYFLLLILSCSFYSSYAQLASEPSTSPTNLSKGTTDLPYTFTLTFDGSGADGYLILRSRNPITATPLDGVAYERGEGLGDAKVFGAGFSTFVPIKEVWAGTEYYFKVFAYNINGSDESSINYLESNPLSGNIRSKGADPVNYYGFINFGSNTLLSELTDLIQDHDMVSYDDYDETLVENLFERDTINGQKVINCQYSNEFKIYTPPFSFFSENYNREHRVPFSWIDFTDVSRSDFELMPEGNDLHQLELVQADVNAQRLNYPFSSDIVSNIYTYKEFIQGRDSDNKDVAQVRADRRGDVARAVFYTMLCYNGKYSRNWGMDNLLSRSENQDIQELIDWHNNDPVDAFEQTRNEYIYTQQNNRNPFIDYPALVDCIDFTDMTLKGSCESVGINQINSVRELKIFPNPAQNSVQIVFDTDDNFNWTLRDLSGKVLMKGNFDTAANKTLNLDLETLSAGYFIFAAENKTTLYQGRIIVNP